MATKETLTIAQIIAECKSTQNKIFTTIGDKDFRLVEYYIKAKPYIGARNIEEEEERITSDIDKVSDLMVRLDALTKARIKANAETMVKVPEQLSLKDLFAGKEAKEEEISIAEAINRKKYYINFMKSIIANFERQLSNASSRKGQLECEAANLVNHDLDQQFPRDVQKNWSTDAQKKAREELEKKYEVVRLDPKNIIANDSINKLKTSVMDYIDKIDTTLSIINAKTEVTIEY
jgi:hypothetical protein